jgi:hypothetical protein
MRIVSFATLWLGASLLLPLALEAQTAPKPKAPAPANPAPTSPAPAAAVASTGGPSAGTLGLNGSWSAATATIGLDYYLDARTFLRGLLGVGLSSTTTTDNLVSPAATQTDTVPEISLTAQWLNETRLTATACWSWGALAGVTYRTVDTTASGGGKRSQPLFVLSAGLLGEVRYFVAPGVALFAEPSVTVNWMPVKGDVITNSAGTKTTDTNTSALELTTGTSSLGFVFYLN